MRRLSLASLAALALLALPGRGLAWGVTGHAIIADIAEHHLSPAALDQVHALLKEEGFEHLDQVASWPDTIRKERPEASPWHYVDIPTTETSYVPERDCRNGDCAIDSIKRFTLLLADKSQPAGKREEALKFLVHFVGDLHQPLHGAENGGDHGGNKIKVSYFGDTGSAQYPLNLHWVWDTSIIERHYGLKEQQANEPNIEVKRAAALAATDIDRHLGKTVPNVNEPDPAVWAMESHEAAKTSVYPGVAALGAEPPAGMIALGADYQKKAWPVVEKRLEMGGLRLADLLNRALGS